MKAVLLARHGGLRALEIVEVPTPQPGPGEVRVKVDFIGINFAEVLSRRGVYGWAPPLPYVPGMEASGRVDRVGEGVTRFAPGDRVMVGTKFGTYAEYVCLDAARVMHAPAGLTQQESAAFVVNYLTAWVGLMSMARLLPSDTLLVTSAAGGVGTAAVQIGAKSGARVIAAAGPGKQPRLLGLGADVALDYGEAGWERRLRDATGGRGADVVLEMSGGAVFRAALRNVAPMGRIVVAGASSAFPRRRNLLSRLASLRDMPRPSIFDMLRRSYGVMSFHVGRLMEAGALDPHSRALGEFARQHALRPVVGQEFPFDRIADAHRALEERTNVGKVVVRLPESQ